MPDHSFRPPYCPVFGARPCETDTIPNTSRTRLMPFDRKSAPCVPWVAALCSLGSTAHLWQPIAASRVAGHGAGLRCWISTPYFRTILVRNGYRTRALSWIPRHPRGFIVKAPAGLVLHGCYIVHFGRAHPFRIQANFATRIIATADLNQESTSGQAFLDVKIIIRSQRC